MSLPFCISDPWDRIYRSMALWAVKHAVWQYNYFLDQQPLLKITAIPSTKTIYSVQTKIRYTQEYEIYAGLSEFPLRQWGLYMNKYSYVKNELVLPRATPSFCSWSLCVVLLISIVVLVWNLHHCPWDINSCGASQSEARVCELDPRMTRGGRSVDLSIYLGPLILAMISSCECSLSCLLSLVLSMLTLREDSAQLRSVFADLLCSR